MKKSRNDREEKSAWSPISNSAVQVCIGTSNFGKKFEFGSDRQSAATCSRFPSATRFGVCGNSNSHGPKSFGDSLQPWMVARLYPKLHEREEKLN
jgi:hypothetical protein